MKMKLVSVVMASMLILAACAQPAPTAPAPEPEPSVEQPADEDDAAVADVDGLDVIVMGTNAEFPPFEFIAEPGQGRFGQFSGVDVAIGMRIAEALGAELYIEDMAFEALIMSLATNQVDFVAAALTVTEERAQEVDFSIPYYTAVQAILVAADNDTINSAEDLYGTIVGVQLGTTSDFLVSGMDGVEVMAYPRPIDAVLATINGQIDAVMVETITAHNFLAAHPDDLRIVYDPEFFGEEFYAIAVPQGQPELLAVINQVIEEMLASGEIDELMLYYTAD